PGDGTYVAVYNNDTGKTTRYESGATLGGLNGSILQRVFTSGSSTPTQTPLTLTVSGSSSALVGAGGKIGNQPLWGTKVFDNGIGRWTVPFVVNATNSQRL